ncbi:TIGR01777 family oxidoreductase [Williamsia herbipolensis]|uniref:TIGR01777 family oxidoreductase n=1 Tax=Williamsia herbipolensis TaxID=1603258 RepID=UPI0005F88E66|nr:TIGR01777 family oxidoreductase [Williamsia herbipolensis]MCX6470614.1 TIGR01777 family oxidoreductase [Mycobacteriales bacterium]
MRVAIAGSSGLIGTALTASLRSDGHEVRRLVRHEPRTPDEIGWAPESFGLTPDALDGVDAVVNLCGVGIGNRPWSGEFKQKLRDSRMVPTQVLADAILATDVPVFVSSSATGIYGFGSDGAGDHASGDLASGDGAFPEMTEDSPAGSGFLAELAKDWERTAALATDARVVAIRTAPVLSPSGGLLGKLRPLFKLGLGGKLGAGHQYMSWITLVDHVRAVRFVLDNDLSGPVNLTAPQPVTNTEFTAAFGRSVHRPAILPVPAPLLRLAGGELAREMLLGGQRAVPKVLTDNGFTFVHPTIDDGMEYANA